jgi:hypothetical protein
MRTEFIGCVYAILKVAAIEGYGHSYIGKLVSIEDG